MHYKLRGLSWQNACHKLTISKGKSVPLKGTEFLTMIENPELYCFKTVNSWDCFRVTKVFFSLELLGPVLLTQTDNFGKKFNFTLLMNILGAFYYSPINYRLSHANLLFSKTWLYFQFETFNQILPHQILPHQVLQSPTPVTCTWLQIAGKKTVKKRGNRVTKLPIFL